MEESGNDHFTKEDISEIVKRVTHDPLNKREAEKRVAGEWIMFAKENSKTITSDYMPTMLEINSSRREFLNFVQQSFLLLRIY